MNPRHVFAPRGDRSLQDIKSMRKTERTRLWRAGKMTFELGSEAKERV